MGLPSLLKDYNNYLNIEKDPNSNCIDLSNIRFVAPASLLPSMFFAISNSIPEYDCHENTEEHIAKILGATKANSNMIPLIISNLEGRNEIERSKIIMGMDNKIRKLLFPSDKKGHEKYGGVGVFPYITGEILSNVEQHSGASNLFMYSQKYPNEGYIDVGILDDGNTIPGKYEQSQKEFCDKDINPYEFKNDCEAIYKSLNGISTKEGFKRAMVRLPSDEEIFKNDEIGYGINTSLWTITEGLGGSLLIASRKGICHVDSYGKKFIKAEGNNIINGTFVCARFKDVQLTDDEFKKYIEKHRPVKDVDF